jgi:hypothetical protein
MSYVLTAGKVDALQINYKIGGRKCSNIIHGVISATGAATSATLLTAVQTFLTGGTGFHPAMGVAFMGNGLKLKQVNGWRTRYGRPPRFTLTLAAGVVTAITIVDQGAGLQNPLNAVVNDITGVGAVVALTIVGGVCTAAAVLFGGTGYTAPVVSTDIPTASVPPGRTNRREILTAFQDRLAYTDVGEVGTDSLPSQNTYSIEYPGNGFGRSGRGSLHLSGVLEANTFENTVIGGAITTWTTIMTALLGSWGLGGQTWVPGVFSPTDFEMLTYPGAGVLSGAFCPPVQTGLIVVNSQVGIMRRRRTLR